MKRAPSADATVAALLRAADAAAAAYDLDEATRLLDVAMRRAPEDPAARAAWIAHRTDRLGDDAGALAGAGALPVMRFDPASRARLAAAAARLGRVDEARRWIAHVDAAQAPDAHAAVLHALLAEGRLAEAAEVARGVRGHGPRSPAVLTALQRYDDAEAEAGRARREGAMREEVRRVRAVLAASRDALEAGRWEGALASLMAHGEPDDAALRGEWRALVDACVARRDADSAADAEARVASVAQRLRAAVDASALRAYAALPASERARVGGGQATEFLDALLDEGRARVSEAIEAALALRASRERDDPAAALAALRPHAVTLRRIPEGRAALEAAEAAARTRRGDADDDRADPRTASLRAEVDALCARGETLAAWWRAREAPALAELTARLGEEVEAASDLVRDARVDGTGEELLAELLRPDAVVARPPGGVMRALSVDDGVVTLRSAELARGGVTARVTADVGIAFEPRSARGDGRFLSLASEDAVVTMDALEGSLRARWRVGSTGLLGGALRPCADPDFAWVLGRDAAGEGSARVLDLARGGVVRGFSCGDAVDLAGGVDVLTHDPSTRQLQLRDAHGVVVATGAFEREGTLLAAVRAERGRGALALFRERHPQTEEDRRRSRPPRFSLVLLRLRAGERGVASLVLRDALRDETGAVASDASRGVAWVRLAPEDLPGELVTVRVGDLAILSRRALRAGVTLRPLGDGEGARLEFVSARRFSWSDDLRRDPEVAGEVPIARFQPSLSRRLPCAPRPSERAWRDHAPTASAILRSDPGALDAALARHRRAPGALLGLVRVLTACGLADAADAALSRACALHPGNAPLRLALADAAWRSGRVGAVRDALEGMELLGLGEELAHARHLLGLSRLAAGDTAGADAAWREGSEAPIARPSCALLGARAALAAREGASVDPGCIAAAARSGGFPAALRAIRDPGLCARRASDALADPGVDPVELRRVAAALAEALRRAPALVWRHDQDPASILARCRARRNPSQSS